MIPERVGIDARYLYDANSRGIGNYLFSIIKNVLSLKSDIKFVLFSDMRECALKPFLSNENFEIHRFPFKGDRIKLWEQIGLPLNVAKSHLDIFHSPGNTLPFIKYCPWVVTIHDTLLMSMDENEPMGHLFYFRKVMPFCLRNARRIITISESSKRDIMRYYDVPEDKIRVIYNGVDESFRRQESPEKIIAMKSRLGIDGKYIFVLGSNSPRKNTMRIIKVFRELMSSRELGCKLVITGVSELDLSKLMSNLKYDRSGFVLVGHVSNDDLISLYSGAEFFIYPSLYEGFGLPLLEAMACGCPVLSSSSACLPEIAGDAAILFNPEDNADIASKILSAGANNVLRKELIERGLNRSKQFNWKTAAAQTLDVYREILRNKICHR